MSKSSSDSTNAALRALAEEGERLREALEAIVRLGAQSEQDYHTHASFHAAVELAYQTLDRDGFAPRIAPCEPAYLSLEVEIDGRPFRRRVVWEGAERLADGRWSTAGWRPVAFIRCCKCDREEPYPGTGDDMDALDFFKKAGWYTDLRPWAVCWKCVETGGTLP